MDAYCVLDMADEEHRSVKRELSSITEFNVSFTGIKTTRRVTIAHTIEEN